MLISWHLISSPCVPKFHRCSKHPVTLRDKIKDRCKIFRYVCLSYLPYLSEYKLISLSLKLYNDFSKIGPLMCSLPMSQSMLVKFSQRLQQSCETFLLSGDWKTNKQTKRIKIRECFQIEKEVGFIRCIHQDSSRKKMVYYNEILEGESSEEASYEQWIQDWKWKGRGPVTLRKLYQYPKWWTKGGIQKESWVERSQGEALWPSP